MDYKSMNQELNQWLRETSPSPAPQRTEPQRIAPEPQRTAPTVSYGLHDNDSARVARRESDYRAVEQERKSYSNSMKSTVQKPEPKPEPIVHKKQEPVYYAPQTAEEKTQTVPKAEPKKESRMVNAIKDVAWGTVAEVAVKGAIKIITGF